MNKKSEFSGVERDSRSVLESRFDLYSLGRAFGIPLGSCGEFTMVGSKKMGNGGFWIEHLARSPGN